MRRISNTNRSKALRFIASRFRPELRSQWRNLGVTPSYHRRTLSYRFSGAGGSAIIDSPADIREWLPGEWSLDDRLALPAGLAPGVYHIALALRDRPGSAPDTLPLPPLRLGIAGRDADGWYPLSEITIE